MCVFLFSCFPPPNTSDLDLCISNINEVEGKVFHMIESKVEASE